MPTIERHFAAALCLLALMGAVRVAPVIDCSDFMVSE